MNPNQTPGSGPNQEPGAGSAGYADNPYYAAQAQGQTVGATQAELDATAPVLRSNESQRLNRKALAFLGGIVLLLLVMLWLVVRNASGKDDAKTRVREEAIQVPELPQVAAAPLPPAPVPVAQTVAEPVPLVAEPPPLPPEPEAVMPVEQGPSLLDRRIAAANAMGEGGGAGGTSTGTDPFTQAMIAALPSQKPQGEVKPEPRTIAQFVQNPDALLVRGTYIRCILETRIVTDVAGYTSCVVTEPVYSLNGRRLLLPKGSKVLGQYRGEPTGPRVEVIWDRVLTPNGIDVTMMSPGIDNMGGAGLPGHYSAHWGSRMGAALLISLISDAFKYGAAEHGPRTTTVTSGGVVLDSPFDSNTARTMERLANQALTKAMNRPATVTLNQGTMITVYVARDVDFSSVLSD